MKFLVAVAFLPLAALADPVTVLGLPLGGALPLAVKGCPDNDKKRVAMCWIERPFVASDGSRLGHVSIPEAALPQWAMYSIAKVEIARGNVLTEINIPDRKLSQQDEIIKSVSARFGRPTVAVYDGATVAEWLSSGVYTEMLCASGWTCSVTFRTEADEMKRRRDKAAHDAGQPARPVSP